VIDIARRARQRCPELALGTDVLVGFPGEDPGAFANTLALLREIEPAYLHAFSFSPRPGTRAAEMPNVPMPGEIKARVSRTIELGRESTRRYRRRQLGRAREVIVEQAGEAGPTGLTDTFVPVRLPDRGLGAGELVHARLEAGSDSARMTAIPVAG
jgi:threonylcarbamoyladenosine tRNA methylthiotransferase MtaB